MSAGTLARIAAWSAGGFALLTLAVALGLTRGADHEATLAIQSVASHPLDVAANLHTYVGLVYVTVGAAFLASVVLWARGQRGLAVAVLGILATGAIELVFKLGLQHSGPPEHFVRAFEYLGPGYQTPSSFPSGHASRITFLSAFAGLATGSGIVRWLAVGAVLATLFLRVYLGDHWISDVLGGAALGLFVAAVSLVVGRRVDERLAQRAASKSSLARRK